MRPSNHVVPLVALLLLFASTSSAQRSQTHAAPYPRAGVLNVAREGPTGLSEPCLDHNLAAVAPRAVVYHRRNSEE